MAAAAAAAMVQRPNEGGVAENVDAKKQQWLIVDGHHRLQASRERSGIRRPFLQLLSEAAAIVA